MNEKANIEDAHAENLFKFNRTIAGFLEKSEGFFKTNILNILTIFFKKNRMLEVCLSSFQSFQTIEFQQTQELINSIRKEIIPEINKMINTQNAAEAKAALETKGENKKLIEQFEKITKVLNFYCFFFFKKKFFILAQR